MVILVYVMLAMLIPLAGVAGWQRVTRGREHPRRVLWTRVWGVVLISIASILGLALSVPLLLSLAAILMYPSALSDPLILMTALLWLAAVGILTAGFGYGMYLTTTAGRTMAVSATKAVPGTTGREGVDVTGLQTSPNAPLTLQDLHERLERIRTSAASAAEKEAAIQALRHVCRSTGQL